MDREQDWKMVERDRMGPLVVEAYREEKSSHKLAAQGAPRAAVGNGRRSSCLAV